MSAPTRSPHLHRAAYAGLDFIKAAFCPLEFTAKKFRDHPEYAHLGSDEGLANLEVGDPLHYPRQFLYTDAHGHAVKADDPDGDTLSFELTVAPSGMSIDSSTGVIKWKPGTSQVGPQKVTVEGFGRPRRHGHTIVLD